MKTAVLTITLYFAILSEHNAQTSFYPSVKWQPSTRSNYNTSSLLNNGSSPSPNQNTNTWHPPVVNEPEKKPGLHQTRITAYYQDGYGTNTSWQRISLKVEIKTDYMGRDEIEIIAYMNELGYWTSLNYGSVSKTSGEITKDFSYQAYLVSKIVYFNL